METAKGKTREEIINRLADRIDSFEKYTQPHSRLIAALATRLARRFGLSSSDVAAIGEAAMLHDIGLWAMSPSYHSQPSPLAFETRLDLWRHPVIGEQQMVKRDAGRHAQLLVRWHHEWWNGSGYPDSLAFEDIPIAARIIRAAELYAALVSDRPYRQAMREEQALAALATSAGIECDPYVVKALLALLEELRETAEAAEASSVETVAAVVGEAPGLAEPAALAVEPGARSESIEAVPAAGDQQPQPSAGGELDARIAGQEAFDQAAQPNGQQPVSELLYPRESYNQVPRPAEQQPPDQPARAQTAPPAPIRYEPGPVEAAPPPVSLERLLLRAQSLVEPESESARWRGWRGSGYNRKSLLGFQASVLRQIEFRSIAIPSWTETRLDWYLRTWGKLIFANDPRAWAATVARARIEAVEPLSEETVTRVLNDVYVPGVKLTNPALSGWFAETDAWWMDNLRRNADSLEDPRVRAQVLTIGLHTGDYALSFDQETRELRRPLTTVFWRIAGREPSGAPGHPHNRCFNQPVEDFVRQARADLLLLSLPSSHTDRGGAEARSEWREAWVTGGVETSRFITPPQSKQSYLAAIDRLLRPASNFRTWAIEYQEPGLASAQDILDLIKEYRPVRATYSKDVTEVAGGLRCYMIVGETPVR